MIRKDDILRATDKGIHVFRHYLGKDFKVGKNFLNPFYRDTKASCNIYYDRKAGVFKMKDFGNEEYYQGMITWRKTVLWEPIVRMMCRLIFL